MKLTAELDCTTSTMHTLSVTLRKIPKVAYEDKVVVELIIFPDTEYGQHNGRPLVKRITLSHRDMATLTDEIGML